MKKPGFLRKAACAWALLAALWVLACPAHAAITYGNDATYVYAGKTDNYTSATMHPGSFGSGSVMFVVIGAAANLGAITVTYGGTAMTLLAGPVSCGDGGITSYFSVYYIVGATSGSTLKLTGTFTGPGRNAWGYLWFSYGGVATSGSPIGTTSINNSVQINSTSRFSQSDSFFFTPSSSSSTIIEYMAFADNCDNAGGGYGVGNGSVRTGPIGAESSVYPETGGAFGDYSPGSQNTFSLLESINPGDECFGGMLWGIELLQNASVATATPSPSATPSASPTGTARITTTASHTATPTMTDTPTISRTPSPSASPTKAGGPPTPTPSPTASPTSLPTVFSGLATTMRPYGLEYVPFPTVTTSSNQFYPLYMTFSASGASSNSNSNSKWGAPCNTSRWHIVFKGLSSVAASGGATLVPNGIEVETRIGPYGVSCTSGVYDQNAYDAATSLVLPSRPQNFSSAYFWISTSATHNPALGGGTGGVPYTERFDAVGDPRFVPYADVLDYSGAASDGLQGGYNWFWRNFNDTSSTYVDGAQDAYYKPFFSSTHGTFDHYAASVSGTDQGENIDIPKLFGLIRNGVMISNGIYSAMTGYDSYYAGQGGEIGGDTSNDFNYGVPCFGGPWGSINNSLRVDEIIGTFGSTPVNVNGAVYVVTGTSSTNIGWTSLPFLGELWPDGLYAADWSSNNAGNATWGNLQNLEEGGTAYRATMQSIPSGSSSGTNYFEETLHHQEAIGCATMLNGTEDGSTTFNHNTTEFDASLLNDGTELSSDYNFSLPSSFEVNRAWGLNQGGNTPPEWSYSPYSGERTHLDVYSATTYTANTNWGFYADNSVSLSSPTYKAAAAIRAIDLNNTLASASATGNPVGGWFIVNGLEPSTQSGINFVAQFALLACLRTFADAGVPTAASAAAAPSFVNANNTFGGSGTASGQTYRIPPIPLISISHPNTSDPTAGVTTLKIEWDERYARWDGQQYDENYPCLDANVGPCSSANLIPNPTLEWHDPQALAYNIIYNVPGTGTSWYSVITGDEVPKGTANNYVLGAAGNYMPGLDAIVPGGPEETSPHEYTYVWNNVPAANYNLRVECFRLASEASTTSYGDYSYHQITVDTLP